jgi:tRNA uridine 5-carboxymethylaminomethyl modification enzyme
VGLISDHAWQDFQQKQERLEGIKKTLENTRVTPEMLERIRPAEVVHAHVGTGGSPVQAEPVTINQSSGSLSSAVGQTLAQLLKRPEITVEQLAPVLRPLSPEFFEREMLGRSISENPRKSVASLSSPNLSSEVRNELKSVETEIKYAGYLVQQQRAMDRLKKSEQNTIPNWFDYRSISGLSREMQEKLSNLKPRTIGQASRIPGVTPAAVSLVNVYIEIQARRREQAAAI